MATLSEQRRPTADDIPGVFELISDGKSLRAACRELGLHTPSTHTFIDADDGLREQYARARECRAESLAEDGLEIGIKASTGKLKADGARVALDAIKWATARMAPKTAPRENHHHTFENLSDAEIDARLAALEAARDTGAQSLGED